MSDGTPITEIAAQAKAFIAKNGPEQAVAMSSGFLLNTASAFRDAAFTVLGLVAARLGVTPTEVHEADGQHHTWSVYAGDLEIGKLTVTLPGGENACVNKTPYQLSIALDVDGPLAARYLCTNPDHHKDDEEPIVELAELPEELKL